MKTGVTAATGQLGQKLLTELAGLAGADNVVGIARSPDNAVATAVEMRGGDYLQAEDWPGALAGLDTVILVSAPVGPWDRVQMHRNVIEGARQAGVRKLLYTSVIGNGRESETLYAPVAAVNRQAEADLQSSGLDWCIPRNGLYLEFDVAHIINAAEGDGIFRNNGGEGRCGYITRDEIAYATARLALDDRHNGKLFNLVGECLTQAELVAIVNDACGLQVRYETITDEACFAGLEPDRGEAVANMLTGCYQCIRNGAYDVPSDFAAAADRNPKTVPEQIREIVTNQPP
jgi:NAD(P)H dehydrogenase (quinone)